MVRKIKIFNSEEDSTFELFGFDGNTGPETDWNGMHQEIGIESYFDDMCETIQEVVKDRVTPQDANRMTKYMQEELYDLVYGKLMEWRNRDIKILEGKPEEK